MQEVRTVNLKGRHPPEADRFKSDPSLPGKAGRRSTVCFRPRPPRRPEPLPLKSAPMRRWCSDRKKPSTQRFYKLPLMLFSLGHHHQQRKIALRRWCVDENHSSTQTAVSLQPSRNFSETVLLGQTSSRTRLRRPDRTDPDIPDIPLKGGCPVCPGLSGCPRSGRRRLPHPDICPGHPHLSGMSGLSGLGSSQT
jgi:hypothetical protein